MAVQVLWDRRNWDLQPYCTEAIEDLADAPQPCISGVGLPRVSELSLVRDGEEGCQTQKPGFTLQPLEEVRVQVLGKAQARSHLSLPG